jgi:hypothetical protein
MYFSVYQGGNDFGPAQALLEINTTLWVESQARVTEHGKTLLFTSNRPGGYGDLDIYRATWNGSEWTDIKNLGPQISTGEAELMAFYDSSSKTLYFTRQPDRFTGTPRDLMQATGVDPCP